MCASAASVFRLLVRILGFWAGDLALRVLSILEFQGFGAPGFVSGSRGKGGFEGRRRFTAFRVRWLGRV